ncbi:MAG: hypothetical protein ACP5KY_00250 [Thermoproteus sp.]
MITIYRDERGENAARVIDLGELRVVSMDVFVEGVEVSGDFRVLEIAGRYKIYIKAREAPEGKVEFVVYDNGARKQLISIRYIGRLSQDNIIQYLQNLKNNIVKDKIL